MPNQDQALNEMDRIALDMASVGRKDEAIDLLSHTLAISTGSAKTYLALLQRKKEQEVPTTESVCSNTRQNDYLYIAPLIDTLQRLDTMLGRSPTKPTSTDVAKKQVSLIDSIHLRQKLRKLAEIRKEIEDE